MTTIQEVPGNVVRSLKDLRSTNLLLLKDTEELIAKSQKQIEELQKLNTEVAKLDPVPPVLIFYRNQFFTFTTTVEGSILGPYNLENYSTLSGYLQEPTTGLIIRVEYRDAAYPAGGLIGQDEWNMYPSKGLFSSFNLPIKGPFVRIKFQGQVAGSSTLSLQANNIKGLPKFQASLNPLIFAEANLGASGSAGFQILDIVGGPINYVLNTGSGLNAALAMRTIYPPSFSVAASAQVNIAPATLGSYTTQGTINIPPFPIELVLYNLGAAAQIVQVILWQ